MGGLRSLRVWVTAGALALLSLTCAVLASPAAFAGLQQERTVSPEPPSTTHPLVLASTGLDITVPIIVGLSLLVLGTVMVGWAFLATGRRGQHR